MINRQTLYILAVLFMVAIFATPVSAIPEATIGIGDGTGEVTLSITVTESTNVGAMTVDLTYDESVIIATGYTKGDMESTIINLDYDDGWIRIVAYQITEVLDSDFILATITFEPVSSVGSCPLEISVETFKDSTPECNAMPYTISNGMYTIDTNPVCTSVTINPAGPFDIYIGNAFELTANCTDQYGDYIECSELDWHSDNGTVGEIIGGIFEGYAPGVANVTATGCGVSNSVQVNVTVEPAPVPTPTERRSSSGGGGTYPPDPAPTPVVGNATDNETDQDDPSSSDTKPADAKPTVNLPGDDKTLDTTPDDKDKSSGGYDPTNAILLVLALLAVCVIGYVIYQKSQR